MNKMVDFVIIGSGASGGVMSYYLSKAGASCALIEAGKNYKPHEYPNNEMLANTQLFWHGATELNKNASTVFLRGKAVGGGTVVNQALLDRFDEIALDDWKSESGIDFFSPNSMDRHYTEIEKHLKLHTFSSQDLNRNAQLYQEGFDKLGLRWQYLRRGQSHCNSEQGNDCIVCLGGCPRQSKQSMATTFIPLASNNGLEIHSEFNVTNIIHGKHFVTVYGRQNGKVKQIIARKAILAAGALGTTQLLLNSGYKKQLPALGEGFHCHPQFISIAFYRENVDAHKGAFQAIKSDDPRFRAQGFKLENVFAGPIAVSLLRSGYGIDHQHFMQRYRQMACIEVAIRDEVPGKIKVSNSGRLVIDKPMSDIDRQRGDLGRSVIKEIFNATGAYEIVESNFNIGLHLMGGCRIGTDSSKSVTDENFNVRGLENFYIADSSIFPMAPGINPSLSIMALTHKASENILAQFGERNVVERTSRSAPITTKQVNHSIKEATS